MQRTLKEHTALPPRSSLKDQQNAFDAFRKEYNEERPHHALDMNVPNNLYTRSERICNGKIEPVEYPTNIETYKVSEMGIFKYGYHRVFLTPFLVNDYVGLEEISVRHMRIHFASVIVGVLDTYTAKVLAYKNRVSIIE